MPARPAADPDHRLLLVQHEPQRRQLRPLGETSRDQESAWLQPHWVGDLTLSARVTTDGSAGAVRFELIEGGVSNRCEIDLATGEAVLEPRRRRARPRADARSKGPAPHDVVFANVDNRLTLLVDGRPVFGDGLTYDDDPETPPRADRRGPRAGRGSRRRGRRSGVSGLVLKRDIYYTLDPGQIDYFTALGPATAPDARRAVRPAGRPGAGRRARAAPAVERLPDRPGPLHDARRQQPPEQGQPRLVRRPLDPTTRARLGPARAAKLGSPPDAC